jgi:hypothetical protein
MRRIRGFAGNTLDPPLIRCGPDFPIRPCGGALQGSRWSSDFAVHYEWCLGVSLRAAGDERDFRAHHLKSCAIR